MIKILKSSQSYHNYDVYEDKLDNTIDSPWEKVIRLTNKLLKVTKSIVRNNSAVSLGMNNT